MSGKKILILILIVSALLAVLLLLYRGNPLVLPSPRPSPAVELGQPPQAPRWNEDAELTIIGAE